MSERKEVGTARKVHLSSGLCIGPELVAAPWLKAGGVREPVGGEPLCPHSEVRCSQHDFITLFRLVENFRTSDIPCVRTEASSKTSMRWSASLFPPSAQMLGEDFH